MSNTDPTKTRGEPNNKKNLYLPLLTGIFDGSTTEKLHYQLRKHNKTLNNMGFFFAMSMTRLSVSVSCFCFVGLFFFCSILTFDNELYH